MRFKSLIVFCVAVLLAGCATTYSKTTATPSAASASNQYYDARLSPVIEPYGFNSSGTLVRAFRLQVVNKSGKDLEVDWNQTQFVRGESTAGGFMFEGVTFSTREAPKPPSVVLPGGTMSKDIFPNSLVELSTTFSTLGPVWLNNPVTPPYVGQTGAYLVIRIDGQEFKERLVFNLSNS